AAPPPQPHASAPPDAPSHRLEPYRLPHPPASTHLQTATGSDVHALPETPPPSPASLGPQHPANHPACLQAPTIQQAQHFADEAPPSVPLHLLYFVKIRPTTTPLPSPRGHA